MTTQQAAYGEVETFKGAVLDDGFLSVLRTRGRKTADRRRERGDTVLIEHYRQEQQPLQGPADVVPQSLHLAFRFRLFCLFGHASHQADDMLFDLGGGQMAVGQPHKSHQQLLVGREDVVEYVFMKTVGFAHLTLHVVAVNGVLKVFLRNADEYLYRNVKRGTFLNCIDHPEGESGQ